MAQPFGVVYHGPKVGSGRDNAYFNELRLLLEHTLGIEVEIVDGYIDADAVDSDDRPEFLKLIADTVWDGLREWNTVFVYEPSRLFNDLELVGALLGWFEDHQVDVEFLCCTEEEQNLLNLGYTIRKNELDPELDDQINALVNAAAIESGFIDAVRKKFRRI